MNDKVKPVYLIVAGVAGLALVGGVGYALYRKQQASAQKPAQPVLKREEPAVFAGGSKEFDETSGAQPVLERAVVPYNPGPAPEPAVRVDPIERVGTLPVLKAEPTVVVDPVEREGVQVLERLKLASPVLRAATLAHGATLALLTPSTSLETGLATRLLKAL